MSRPVGIVAALLMALALAVSMAHAADESAGGARSELMIGDDCKKPPKFAKKYRQYCRPPLFHPTTALAEYRLRQAAADASRTLADDRVKALSDRIATLEATLKPPALPERIEEPPPLVLHVQAPALLTGDVPEYDVLITDDCPDGKVPIVIVDPSIAAKPVARIEGKQFKVVLVTKPLTSAQRVRLSVMSCQAFGSIRTQAEQKQLVFDEDIPFLKSIPITIITRLNVWARADVAEEFGDEFSRTFIVADAVVQNTQNGPILVYGASLTASVRFLMARPDVEAKFGAWAIRNPTSFWTVSYGGERALAEALDFTDIYRPLSFSDVLAIFSYKREADPRQRSISALKSLGTLLTAGSVFGVTTDYLQGVTFFTGAFVPEIEKQLLWDVLLHVKNLEQRSFKEVEEIPAGGQLRKVVFFPRRPIEGIVPFGPLYIAEILGDELKLSGVLMKETEPLQGVADPNQPSNAPSTPPPAAAPRNP
jgi:hypothetical protein